MSLDLSQSRGSAAGCNSGIRPHAAAWGWCRIMLPLLAQALSWAAPETRAGEIRLAWDPVAAAAGYRIHYGTAPGDYSMRVDVGNVSTCTLANLAEGATYFFAATAYDASGLESAASNEVSAEIPDPAAPVAAFAASPRLGKATLAVRFDDASKGDITERTWRFGDGGTSSERDPVHVYQAPGVYTVTLSVAGAKGQHQKTGRDFVTVTTEAPDNGLVAAYGFEEVGGSIVVDASGHANHGRIVGARRAARGAAAGGKSLFFAGSGARVVVPSHPSLDLSDAMTLEAWVLPTGSGEGWQTVLVKEDGVGNSAYYLYATALENRALFGARIGAYEVLNSAWRLPAGRWTHLAGTYDGSRLRLYQNGVLVGSRQQRGLIPKAEGVLSIGSNAIWGESFRGYVDEVRIYNRALSRLEIRVDRKRPATPAGSGDLRIVVSRSPTRDHPRVSQGFPAWGAIYAFAHAAPDIARVNFWLDDPSPAEPLGPPLRTADLRPFDFSGQTDEGAALAFDTRVLSAGVHTVTAQGLRRDGAVAATAQGTWVISSTQNRPRFFVSSNPDRSNPKALAGMHLSGEVYVFTSYFPGVKRVEFWLDDPSPGAPAGIPIHTEYFPPYDLMGSTANGSALAFSTATLSRGRHTIAARLTRIDGKRRRIGPAAFFID